ncbi:MAG: hypothetical protein F6J86_12930 [Symploca sp. SIO1B1]|nr:hypothetical protein [Symploca sp. SIO1B1]
MPPLFAAFLLFHLLKEETIDWAAKLRRDKRKERVSQTRERFAHSDGNNFDKKMSETQIEFVQIDETPNENKEKWGVKRMKQMKTQTNKTNKRIASFLAWCMAITLFFANVGVANANEVTPTDASFAELENVGDFVRITDQGHNHIHCYNESDKLAVIMSGDTSKCNYSEADQCLSMGYCILKPADSAVFECENESGEYVDVNLVVRNASTGSVEVLWHAH